ncbi:restriction endonuclease subunit S [Vibrio splendidus]|uniref:restriction endonuclease subunit S n=1 Tax=Vibrio splendidus TaxID=29497 RepID=UPI000769FCE0|nr:restriction endonuclease subunit S [Vibrio splendidus]
MNASIKPFKDLITDKGVFSDGDWVESKDQDPLGDVRLIQLADIGVGKFINKSKRFMTSQKTSDLNCTFLEEGDILIARMPDPIGRACIFPGVGCKAVTVVDICIVRPNNAEIDSRWLMHLINSNKFNHQILQYVTGTTRQRISRGNLAKLDVEVPPLAEQKRIAAILDKADAIRQKRKQAIDLADEFLRSVFLDMFGDPVTNPKGWEVSSLSSVADVITGFAFKSSEYVEDSETSVRLCRGANTLVGHFDWKDTAYYPKSHVSDLDKYLLEEGDIVLAMDRPWISSGLKVCMQGEYERDTYLVQRVARIRANNANMRDYLHSCILSKSFETHCCPTETTVPHISPVELKNFGIMLPSLDVIERYGNSTKVINELKRRNEVQLVKSNDMFNSLSQKAFSGEL